MPLGPWSRNSEHGPSGTRTVLGSVGVFETWWRWPSPYSEQLGTSRDLCLFHGAFEPGWSVSAVPAAPELSFSTVVVSVFVFVPKILLTVARLMTDCWLLTPPSRGFFRPSPGSHRDRCKSCPPGRRCWPARSQRWPANTHGQSLVVGRDCPCRRDRRVGTAGADVGHAHSPCLTHARQAGCFGVNHSIGS